MKTIVNIFLDKDVSKQREESYSRLQPSAEAYQALCNVLGGKVHALKCERLYWQQIKEGKKTFEVRLNDRGFEEGDILFLFPYWSGEGVFGDDDVLVYRVTSCLFGPGWGIDEDYVVMSIQPYMN